MGETLKPNPVLVGVTRVTNYVVDHGDGFKFGGKAILAAAGVVFTAVTAYHLIVNQADAAFAESMRPKFADPGHLLESGEKYFPTVRVSGVGRTLDEALDMEREGGTFNIRRAGFPSEIVGEVPVGTTIDKVIINRGPWGVFDCERVIGFINRDSADLYLCAVESLALGPAPKSSGVQ